MTLMNLFLFLISSGDLVLDPKPVVLSNGIMLIDKAFNNLFVLVGKIKKKLKS